MYGNFLCIAGAHLQRMSATAWSPTNGKYFSVWKIKEHLYLILYFFLIGKRTKTFNLLQIKMKTGNPKNRELRITKTFNAPIELVWEAWTNREHIVNWWAPTGFTTTIHKMDVREGGEWLMTLHGPDGKNYPNKSIFREIIPLKKIVYEHFNPDFIGTAVFESKNNKTLMEWALLFATTEMLKIVVKTFKADEGLKQNVEKLENYLSQKIHQNENMNRG